MQPAQPAWAAALAAASVSAPVSGVLAGIDARPVRSADAVRTTLVRQIAEPIAWEDCLAALAEHGVTQVLDLGPGQDQSRLLREALPHVEVLDWQSG
jgi:[acyl-carrier-protein] S-malonyltransferase